MPTHRTTSAEVRSIVIPVVAGIGNALMAEPMVRVIGDVLPGAQVTIVARLGVYAECFAHLRHVTRSIVSGPTLRGMLRAQREVRRLRADVFLVPFPSNRWEYSLLAATSGARRRILHAYPVGYFKALHFLWTERIAAWTHLHDVEQNTGLLVALTGTKERHTAPFFGLNDDAEAQGRQLWQEAGLPHDATPIVMHAGSGKTLVGRVKRWPPERYGRLIDALHADGHEVLMLEGPDEAGVAQEVVRHVAGRPPYVLRLRGKLAAAAAVLQRCRLYVGTDSGLAHLAAAVGTAPVTFFGPADPNRIAPYGYRHLVLQADHPHANCLMYPWQSAKPKLRVPEASAVEAIEALTLPEVLTFVRRVLDDPDMSLQRVPQPSGEGRDTNTNLPPAEAVRPGWHGASS
ncbi:MAG: glycosyltransferase family 9 protein [Phycisphaerae bacterium]